ncbi:hypothetical protein ACFUTU_09905 [Arthrobacter sp. NPDC057388]|uniref:hypothetical protein n=1 Tax=Arthrobacter sp. NPDC057388 TaxID=3346116 RepID=UPI00363682E4
MAAPAAPAAPIFPAVQATDTDLPLAGTGLSLAELHMTTPERPELAAAKAATHKLHLHAQHGEGHLDAFAVSEGTSGNSSSGSEASGAQAAEAAGEWDRTQLFAGARVFDAVRHLPASPAFDPGCSPD